MNNSSIPDKNAKAAQNGGEKPKSKAIEVPSISLPKGGGAIKGIDEKFSVNAVNGTSSFSIPLPFSPARGVSPEISLSYNSGGGNGTFGLGWNISLPSIKRKTEKKLPQYLDSFDSDIFLFSEAEDLVSEFRKIPTDDDSIVFELDANGDYIIDEKDSPDLDYTIRFYKPRIEGLFARIERWSAKDSDEVKWRVITKDNVTSLFGWTATSRISDPENENRIFEWLPEWVFDDKGNCTQYIYKKEDIIGLDESKLHNRNRVKNNQITYTNCYLDRVLYGVKTPFGKFGDPFPVESDYMFETKLDYGTLEDGYSADTINEWDLRPDAFSDYRAGFEIRTTRLCRRVLLFHHFEGYDGLVRSLDFHYDTNLEEDFTFLKTITSVGYDKKPDGTYLQKQLPPMEFGYQEHEWNKEVKSISLENLFHAPAGMDERQYQFTDLYNEGLSGMLTEQANGWYYKQNLGNGDFANAKLVSPKPSFTGLGSQLQLADLDANGGKQLVNFGMDLAGFFELDEENEWQPFRTFKAMPNIDFGDPNTRLLDLNGDGMPDVVISEDNVFTWYPSKGKKGYGKSIKTTKSFKEEAGPNLVFSDPNQTVFLADMSGTGLTDIVRIRNGEVCYWPNLGYGKFGAKVGFDQAPVFDHSDAFNPAYIRLVDIDGSGTSDIIYLGKNKFTCHKNLNGNRFSTHNFEIDPFPEIHSLANVTVADILGNGLACIVWSSPLSKDAHDPLKYIDLMGSRKPHIMVSYKNNLGKEVTLEYSPSTQFYLADKAAGQPWITKLHFPVHLLTKTTVHDKWTKTTIKSKYSYHHGYYDHAEREFRGFGRVEQVDAEDFGTFAAANSRSPYITEDLTLYQPPIKTITWYHTGAFLGKDRILNQFETEYFAPKSDFFEENDLPEPDLVGQHLSPSEWPQALRACKGMVLRQEVYELDVKAWAVGEEEKIKLYSCAYSNCQIHRIQPEGYNPFAVFMATPSESITYHYELDLRSAPLSPDPRIAHSLNLKSDQYGNPLESLSVAYPRILRHEEEGLPDGAIELIAAVQQESLLVFGKNTFTQDIITEEDYRLRLPCESKTYELTGISPSDTLYFSIEELRAMGIGDSVEEIPYHRLPNRLAPQKRCVEWSRLLYFSDGLVDPLPWGNHTSKGLPYETYTLALTTDLLEAIFKTGQLTTEVLDDLNNANESGYLSGDDLADRFPDMETGHQYWIRSGIAGFHADAAAHFYLAERYTNPFGQVTVLEYDSLDLFIQSSTNAVGNQTAVGDFDYRVLAPRRMVDINLNISEVIFDVLGSPAAVAVLGKGEEGDNLIGFEGDILHPDMDTMIRFFSGDYDPMESSRLLGNASARHLYYFGEQMGADGSITYGQHPACAAGIVREVHVGQGGENSPVQAAFEYSDGSGNVLVQKVQAESENVDGPLRWIANGKTILNNKGNPVKQYEPYFSEEGHSFEETLEVGVTAILYYDAADRPIRTELPDGTFTRVEFSPWFSKAYDANDTVLDPNNKWFSENSAGSPAQQRAARLSAVHSDTPAVVHFDSKGQEVISIAHNRLHRRTEDPIIEEKYLTYTKLDTEGKPLWIKDARGNRVMQYIYPYKPDGFSELDWDEDYSPCYDIAGNLLFQHSMDAGDRWILADAMGQPFYAWDENDKITESGNVYEYRTFHTDYDELRRPTEQKIKINAGEWQVIERIIYGESQADASLHNCKGQVYRHYDSGGLVSNQRFDFKGNLLEVTKQLTSSYDQDLINWDTEILSEEVFTQISAFDALNRMTNLQNWHLPGASPATYVHQYNERGLLKSEKLTVNGVKTDAVIHIEYNVKGQRTRMQYGNGSSTRYHYDRKTFRLKQLRTTSSNPGEDLPRSPSNLTDRNVLQNLYYTYDPSGNITEILDYAYALVFFNNQEVEPRSLYRYDALYQLIAVRGRENYHSNGASGQFADAAVSVDFLMNDSALRNYRQDYTYDPAGNIEEMRHSAAGGSWTRYYTYATDNNRLLSTRVGHESTAYRYDTHGSMMNIGNVPDEYQMQWDYRDMVHTVNLGGGGRVYYNYAADKQRVRKRIEKGAGYIEERIYLGGMEIYRRWQGGSLVESIETHHLMVDEQRVLMVENVIETDNNQLSTGILHRYQYSNHLGSVGLECDGTGNIISYEEYHPYGTTAYQAKNTSIKASAKRYRYTGMERDEESGLANHTARYYLPWLGRWLSADPIGIKGNSNLYLYVDNKPLKYLDRRGTENEDVDWEKERRKHTGRKSRARAKASKTSSQSGKIPDPNLKTAIAEKNSKGRTPIQEHHHANIDNAKIVGANADRIGDAKRMTSVWSTLGPDGNPTNFGNHGNSPSYVYNNNVSLTPHNILESMDDAERARVPKTIQGLEDAADNSKWRTPATADYTERAKMDWTHDTTKGRNPQAGLGTPGTLLGLAFAGVSIYYITSAKTVEEGVKRGAILGGESIGAAAGALIFSPLGPVGTFVGGVIGQHVGGKVVEYSGEIFEAAGDAIGAVGDFFVPKGTLGALGPPIIWGKDESVSVTKEFTNIDLGEVDDLSLNKWLLGGTIFRDKVTGTIGFRLTF